VVIVTILELLLAVLCPSSPKIRLFKNETLIYGFLDQKNKIELPKPELGN